MCLTAGAGGVATAEVEAKVGPGVGHRGGAVPEPHPLRRDRAAPHEVEREHRGRAQQPCKQVVRILLEKVPICKFCKEIDS